MVMAPQDQFMPVFARANPQYHSTSIVCTQRASSDIHEQYRAALHGVHHDVAPTTEHGDRPKGSRIGERLLKLRCMSDGDHAIGVRGQSQCIASRKIPTLQN
jgi:hypothetical protein